MKLALEHTIPISFILGILIGHYLSSEIVSIFIMTTKLFVKFVSMLAPLIIFLVVLSSIPKLINFQFCMRKAIIILILTPIAISYVTLTITCIVLILTGSVNLSVIVHEVNYVDEIARILIVLFTNPTLISLTLALTTTYILLKLNVVKFTSKLNLYINYFFKSLTYVLPIVTFMLGIVVSFELRQEIINLIIELISYVLIIEFIVLSILIIFMTYRFKIPIVKLVKYVINVFIYTLPIGSSYLVLPINIRIFKKIFPEILDEVINLVLTVGASLNRCGSLLGVVVSLIVTLKHFNISIPLLTLMTLTLLLPIIGLGSPGIHGGTIIVVMPLIMNLITNSQLDVVLAIAFALFTGISTFIHVTLNTITNGLMTLIFVKKVKL